MKKNFVIEEPLHIIWLTYIIITSIVALFPKVEIVNSAVFCGTRVLILVSIFSYPFFNSKLNNTLLNIFNFAISMLTLAVFYGETAALNQFLLPYLDVYFVKIEALIFHSQPSILFSSTFSSVVMVELMNMGYFSYYLIIISFPILVMIFYPQLFQKVLFYLMTSFYLYYLIFILLPVAGPQYYFSSDFTGLPEGVFFQKIIAIIQHTGEVPTGAFPSSHVGITFIVLMMSYRISKNYFFIILPFTILLFASTVYIKAHYLVDVIAGFISAPLILEISKFLYTRLNLLNNKPYEHSNS
jgi:membrane-associated phospholipid phosphatase